MKKRYFRVRVLSGVMVAMMAMSSLTPLMVNAAELPEEEQAVVEEISDETMPEEPTEESNQESTEELTSEEIASEELAEANEESAQEDENEDEQNEEAGKSEESEEEANITEELKTAKSTEEPEKDTKAFYATNTVVKESRQDFKPGDIDKFTVIIFIEGDDPDCTNALIGGEMKMHMEITEEHVD